MTILQAVAILEAGMLECKRRKIDTPELREALDFLAPHIQPVGHSAIRRARPASLIKTMALPSWVDSRCCAQRSLAYGNHSESCLGTASINLHVSSQGRMNLNPGPV